MAKYAPIQVLFATDGEREDAKRFCKDIHGKSFGEFVRAFIRKAQREQAQKETGKKA